MLLQTVRHCCQSFLTTYFGPEEGTDDGQHGDRRALGLRLIALGIEQAVQGELIHYLRAKPLMAVAQCAVAKNTIDIGIFSPDWTPDCLIQLKHRSANQGTVDVLLNNMRDDERKHSEGPQARLPLIQIGLYTEITSPFDRLKYQGPAGLYRFLSTYCRSAAKQSVSKQQDRVQDTFNAPLVAPAPLSFEIPGTTVNGRVGWILKVLER